MHASKWTFARASPIYLEVWGTLFRIAALMLTISVRSTQPTAYPTGTRFSCCQIRVAHVVQVHTRRFGALTPEGNRGERVMLVTQLLQNQRGGLRIKEGAANRPRLGFR